MIICDTRWDVCMIDFELYFFFYFRFSGIPAEGIKASDVGLDRCTCKLHRPLLLHGWLIITMFCEGFIIAKLSTCDSGICRCKVTEIKKKIDSSFKLFFTFFLINNTAVTGFQILHWRWDLYIKGRANSQVRVH